MRVQLSSWFLLLFSSIPLAAMAPGVDQLNPASVPALRQEVVKFPFAPSVYTLRATKTKGSSLVLLDANGKETIILEDPKPAQGKGLFRGVAHASPFGPFSCTPDLKEVVYTIYRDPVTPPQKSSGMAFGGMGISVSTQGTFGEWDFEGLYVWNRETGKSEQIADLGRMKAIGKAWYKTPEGERFDREWGSEPLHKDLKSNSPTYLFHLMGKRFLWITRSYILLVDIATRDIKPLWASVEWEAESLLHAAFHAWQEPDGTVVAFRGKSRLQMDPLGALKVLPWVPLEKWMSIENRNSNKTPTAKPAFSGWAYLPSTFLFCNPTKVVMTDGDSCLLVTAQKDGHWEKAEEWHFKHDKLLVDREGGSIYAYSHFKTSNDQLTRLDLKGTVLWTADLGNCRNEFKMLDTGARLYAHVLRVDGIGEQPYRLALDPATGRVLEATLWEKAEVAASSPGSLKTTLAPPLLDDMAFRIPTGEGSLVWLPSSGEVDEASPSSAWEPSQDATLTFKNPTFGTWAWMEEDGWMRPLFRRPLADQILLILQGLPTRLPISANTGMVLGTGAGTGPLPFPMGPPRGPGAPPSFGWMGSDRPRTAPFPYGQFLQVTPPQLTEFAKTFPRTLPPPISAAP